MVVASLLLVEVDQRPEQGLAGRFAPLAVARRDLAEGQAGSGQADQQEQAEQLRRLRRGRLTGIVDLRRGWRTRPIQMIRDTVAGVDGLAA